MHDLNPEWGLLGDMGLDWPGQMDALLRDHTGVGQPRNTLARTGRQRLEASRLCGERLRELVHEARAGRNGDHMATSEATVVHRFAGALDGVTPYHWFVVIIASGGWLFDCMDQRLFVLARESALKELLAGDPARWPPSARTAATPRPR